MKRVSVAQAKNRLPALLHDAERAPVEIARRGKPIAVLVSRAAYAKLNGEASHDAWTALERFRAAHDLAELDLGSALDGVRDSRPGRGVRL